MVVGLQKLYLVLLLHLQSVKSVLSLLGFFHQIWGFSVSVSLGFWGFY